MDFAKAAKIRQELGLDGLRVSLPPDFDNPRLQPAGTRPRTLKLLLDTHIVIWAALDPDALTTSERKRMAEAGTPLVLSAVAVWDLRLK